MIEKLRAVTSTRRTVSSQTIPVFSSSLMAFREGKRVENCSPGAAFASRHHGAHSRVSNANLVHEDTPNYSLMLEENTQSPHQEVLLLEGDEFHVSSDGTCRTYYKLKSWPQNENSVSPVSLEECYDLNHARKTFIIRRDFSSETHRNSLSQNLAALGTPLNAFDLKEIDQGVLGSAGTGATTWESSIAMSLFFSSNPTLLFGNVVELGSGVGLAGLLCQTAYSSAVLSNMLSLTLTDASEEVLEQCRQNLNQVESSGLTTQVKNLNWYDFIDNNTMAGSEERYDTVLASDCAYRYSDLVALASTMTALLQKKKTSHIHIFGPYNRGALQELVEHFKDDSMLNVEVDWIQMDRFRFKPSKDDNGFHSFHNGECSVASRNTAKFLHITVRFKDTVSSDNGRANESLADID